MHALLGVLQLLACTPDVHAGVVLGNTRVVFPGDAREVTLRLSNEHEWPVLVETWVDASAEASLVPFAPDPPLVRIDAGKGQVVRLHRLPGALAADRETLFWLNVLDVPPNTPARGDASELKIALRTRVKLFHRPGGLAGSAAQAPAQLRWRHAAASQLEVENPTPYHVTIARIADGEAWSVQGEMVAPYARLLLERAPDLRGDRVVFEAINDSGGRDRFESRVGSR